MAVQVAMLDVMYGILQQEVKEASRQVIYTLITLTLCENNHTGCPVHNYIELLALL